MRVYVAAKFEEKEAARAAMRALEAAGHTVTHDWTHEDVTGLTGEAERVALGRCALADCLGAYYTDAFILLHHPQLRGGLVELGLALGSVYTQHVIVVGAADAHPRCIFYDVPGVVRVDTVAQAVAHLTASEGEREAA